MRQSIYMLTTKEREHRLNGLTAEDSVTNGSEGKGEQTNGTERLQIAKRPH